MACAIVALPSVSLISLCHLHHNKSWRCRIKAVVNGVHIVSDAQTTLVNNSICTVECCHFWSFRYDVYRRRLDLHLLTLHGIHSQLAISLIQDSRHLSDRFVNTRVDYTSKGCIENHTHGRVTVRKLPKQVPASHYLATRATTEAPRYLSAIL